MIQDKINAFTRDLTSLAAEYSDPVALSKIMSENVPFLAGNGKFAMMTFIGLMVAWRILRGSKKSRKQKANKVAMVMPAPFAPELDEMPGVYTAAPAAHQAAEVSAPVRDPADDLDAVLKANFQTKPIFNRDTQRTRATLDATLQALSPDHTAASNLALGTILIPDQTCSGETRSDALFAIADKYLPLGVLDASGQLVIAFQIEPQAARKSSEGLRNTVVNEALSSAGIPIISISSADNVSDLTAKLTPYIGVSLRRAPEQRRAPADAAPITRPGRPARPKRPTVRA